MTLRVFNDVLPSGLTVVTVETPHLHSASCAVHVRVGSRHETPQNNGVSHLLEHLFFRGSRRYPDSVKMNAAVEAIGGNLNGVTMRDLSVFYTPAHPDGVPVALRILGDMLSRPRLVQLEIEKRIILEEMLDEVDERGRDIDVDNLAKRVMFGDHPLALKIAGTPQTVKGLSLKLVREHFRRAYVTGNLVVAVAGPLHHRTVLREVRECFRHLPEGPRLSERRAPELSPTGPRLHFVSLDEAQVEFRLTFPAVSEDHPDFAALSTLRRVVDDGLSSRLPHNVVEKRGLAYSIGASLEAFHDVGTFDVDGATAPENLSAVAEEVLRTLSTLRRGQISDEELQRAKRRHRMQLDFMKDSPSDLSGWFGASRLFREVESFEARIEEVERLKRGDLKAAARKYLTHETLSVIAVGPRSARKKLQHVVDNAKAILHS